MDVCCWSFFNCMENFYVRDILSYLTFCQIYLIEDFTRFLALCKLQNKFQLDRSNDSWTRHFRRSCSDLASNFHERFWKSTRNVSEKCWNLDPIWALENLGKRTENFSPKSCLLLKAKIVDFVCVGVDVFITKIFTFRLTAAKPVSMWRKICKDCLQTSLVWGIIRYLVHINRQRELFGNIASFWRIMTRIYWTRYSTQSTINCVLCFSSQLQSSWPLIATQIIALRARVGGFSYATTQWHFLIFHISSAALL